MGIQVGYVSMTFFFPQIPLVLLPPFKKIVTFFLINGGFLLSTIKTFSSPEIFIKLF